MMIDVEPHLVSAARLTPGDIIDLEGDTYADPNGDGTCGCDPDCIHYLPFEFEYNQVVDVVQETDTVIRVDLLEHGSFGFPPDHPILVVGFEEVTNA